MQSDYKISIPIGMSITVYTLWIPLVLINDYLENFYLNVSLPLFLAVFTYLIYLFQEKRENKIGKIKEQIKSAEEREDISNMDSYSELEKKLARYSFFTGILDSVLEYVKYPFIMITLFLYIASFN